MGDRGKLCWQQETSNSEWAYSGDIIVGMIAHQSVGEHLWAYKVDGVAMKWTAKGHGTVKTRASAKRAVERAWSTWLERAGLS